MLVKLPGNLGYIPPLLVGPVYPEDKETKYILHVVYTKTIGEYTGKLYSYGSKEERDREMHEFAARVNEAAKSYNINWGKLLTYE